MTEQNTETRGGKFKRYAKAAIKGSAKGAAKGLTTSLLARGAIQSIGQTGGGAIGRFGSKYVNEAIDQASKNPDNAKIIGEYDKDGKVINDAKELFSSSYAGKAGRIVGGGAAGMVQGAIPIKNRHIMGAGAIIGGLKGIRNEYKRSKREKELTKEARSANVKKRVSELSPESQRKYELNRGIDGLTYSSTGGSLSKTEKSPEIPKSTRKERHSQLMRDSGFDDQKDKESFVEHMKKRRNFSFFGAKDEDIKNYFSDRRPVNDTDLNNFRKRKDSENKISETRQTPRGKGAGQQQHQRDNARHSNKPSAETDSNKELNQKVNGGLGTAAKVGAGAAAAYGTYRVGKHLYNKYKQKKDQGMEKEAKSKNVAQKLMEASRAASAAYHESRKARMPKDYDPTTTVHEHHRSQVEKTKNPGTKPKIKSLDDFLNHTFY